MPVKTKMRRAICRYFPFALLAGALLGGWEMEARLGLIPRFILPAPSEVIKELVRQWRPLLLVHLPATLQEALLGLALSLVLGMIFGILMFRYEPIARALYPLLLFSQTIPLIALSPIFMVWFGYSMWGKVAVVWLTAFFPVAAGTYDGLKQSEFTYRELMLTLGATRGQLLWKAQLPPALPALFSGAKLAGVYSVIGATIGEWLGGSRGLGYYSRRMAGSLQSGKLFAAVLLLSVLGAALSLSVSLLEKWILKKRSRYR